MLYATSQAPCLLMLDECYTISVEPTKFREKRIMCKAVDEMRNVAQQRARARARALRERARSQALRRKEEYLGARVSRDLKERVIAQARRMGIPVSILIRNVLEEAFGGEPRSGVAKGGVSHAGAAGTNLDASMDASMDAGGGGDVAPEVATAQKRPPQAAAAWPEVLGWERITLNRAMRCSACSQDLVPGTEVTLGLPIPGGEHVILCAKCK